MFVSWSLLTPAEVSSRPERSPHVALGQRPPLVVHRADQHLFGAL